MSTYDGIAPLYDAWSTGVIEDISFYVEEALASGGPVVELSPHRTGRIAIPTAAAGVNVMASSFLRRCSRSAQSRRAPPHRRGPSSSGWS